MCRLRPTMGSSFSASDHCGSGSTAANSDSFRIGGAVGLQVPAPLDRGRPTPKEQLMHLLWPSATPWCSQQPQRRRTPSAALPVRRRTSPHGGVQVERLRARPDVAGMVDLDAFLNHAAAARECARADDRSGELRELRAAAGTLRRPAVRGRPLRRVDFRSAPHGARPVRSTCSTYWPVATVIPATSTAVSTPPGRTSTQPQHEIAHRTLMSTYAQLGASPGDARVRGLRARLRAELDLTPGRETMALFAPDPGGRSGQVPTTNGSLRANE